jgi:phosphosulfolactate synthase
VSGERPKTWRYLHEIGVPDIAPRLSPFDPGYELTCLAGHLAQSHHLMRTLKISMACWMVAQERTTRAKVKAAEELGVPTVTGGGPFEVAVAQGALPAYLALCADIGFSGIEAGSGFTEMTLEPAEVLRLAREHGLEVQFELGSKHGGAFTGRVLDGLLDQGQSWLDAGAVHLVVEARESARGVGLFDDRGELNRGFADRFAERFGLEPLIFEAPDKPSQFALLDHFGRDAHLCNVRLEEILRVEIYRRGLHSDAFRRDHLRPRKA